MWPSRAHTQVRPYKDMVNRRVVAGVIRRGGDVLLVEQQGPADDRPSWAVPGGAAEPGETELEALWREVQEETGLQVLRAGGLAYSAQINGAEGTTTANIYQVESWEGTVRPADPDGLTLAAGFWPVPRAVQLVEETLAYRVMREPLVAYLRGDAAAGRQWFYEQAPQGKVQLQYALRPATADDYTFLYDLLVAALKPYVAATWGWDEQFQKAYFAEHFDPSNVEIVVKDSRDVGQLSVTSTAEQDWVNAIYLLPESQRHGLGTAILENVIGAARNRDKRVGLQVLKVNGRARRLYERLGFKVTEETENYYRMRYDGS